MNRRALILLALSALLLEAGACTEQTALARLPEAQPAPTASPARAVPAPAPAPAAPRPEARQVTGQPGASAASGVAPLLSGSLEPHRRSTLSASVTGPVARVHVKEGQRVTAGQALVSIKAESFQLGVRQAEAALQGARVQLEAARLDHDRIRGLLAERAVPRSQFEAVASRYQGAQAGLSAAQVGVEMARKALRDALVRAPYAGLVVKRFVAEGDYATSMPPTPLLAIEEVGVLDLRIQVPAGEADRIKAGSPLLVRFTATGQQVRARVARVVSSIDPRTRTFAAIAEIQNPGGELRPGLFAEVIPQAATN